jgi:hypothetical protein
MPYIQQEARDAIDEGCTAQSVGQLNYAITSLIDEYLVDWGDKLSYGALNEVIGVLECAKLELYRRIAAPFEDLAMIRNGDVYSRVPPTPLEDQP